MQSCTPRVYYDILQLTCDLNIYFSDEKNIFGIVARYNLRNNAMLLQENIESNTHTHTCRV